MDLSQFSDEQLIQEIREGKSELYSEIIRRYQNKLYGYLCRLSNDGTESEDILQNVFIKSYRNLHGFDVGKKFSSWIYRIAHNEAINHIKKNFRNIPLESLEFNLIDNNNLEDEADKLILKKKMENYLENIPVKYREPLILYFFEEKSYEEISDILRIPTSTVGTLIFRGKKMIKNLVSV